MRTAFMTLVLVVALGVLNAAAAERPDPHALFETRCQRCHDSHSGPFARDRLAIRDGTVVSGKTGRPVAALLQNHFGSLAPGEIAILIEAFTLQIQTDGLFQRKCTACHRSGKALARKELIIDGARLKGRYSGLDTGEFLKSHGRLTPEEAETIADMLRWQLQVMRPQN